jgi:cytochrome P450
MLHIKLALLFLASALLFYRICQAIVLHFKRQAFKKEHGCKEAKTKYPLKDPFFGIDLIIDTIKNAKKHRHLEGTWKRYEKHGTTFTSRLVTSPTVFTIDPENIKTMLATRFEDFRLSSIRVEAMVPIFGKGIFTTDGALWQHSRALLRPTFAKENVANLDTIEEHFKKLLRCIPQGGATVDLQPLFFRLTMDTATEFLFGHSVQSQLRALEAEGEGNFTADAEFVEEYTYTQFEASHNVRLGPCNKFRYSPRANAARTKTFKYVDSYIDELFSRRTTQSAKTTEQGKQKKYVFLEELANQTSDRTILRDQILNVLLAGRDTTACLLSNMFFMVARHPHVWAKLQAEVKELHGNRPTYDKLRNMKYLRQCINECRYRATRGN